jgi:hypothetical protein
MYEKMKRKIIVEIIEVIEIEVIKVTNDVKKNCRS